MIPGSLKAAGFLGSSSFCYACYQKHRLCYNVLNPFWRYHGLEETLKLILSELKDIKNSQARLEEKIERIDRKMTGIPESYEKLEEFVGRQQQMIEELSARSIEYGAETKELNRSLRNQKEKSSTPLY